ncbi:YdgH/BhsA/McbA-like domain containing protein [Type-D symbiont of Plautia stali]|uniref:YdgH/BhsA/McbA-like domain containing protein n=1 Tax=Type-D symbiont of Plautia stali TaxID=1560356 RepID=UPI00073EA31C|nr:YdgH/BhsA/McbA-like domain containing protein [Type-D symbiont of Plautia stali]
MKKIIIATLLALSTAPAFSSETNEINRSHQCELLRIGSITAVGGTVDDLTHKLEDKANAAGADYFRVTHLNTDNQGYATATLYKNADVKV